MNVGELCIREVVITKKDTSIHHVAKLMREHHVGDVVIVEEKNGENVPVGIITDRDIVIELLATDVDLKAVAVGDIMSFDLLTTLDTEDVFVLIKKMQSKGVRRVPVVNNRGGLEGIISVDDLIDVFSEQMMNFVKLFFRGRDFERQNREI